MKNFSAQWQILKNYLYKHYGQESGKMIVHAGLLTWTMASLAQLGAIVLNDKISKEQKKFLIPQEIADGLINIVAFYALTNSLKSIASRLVSTGKWSNEAIRNFVLNNNPAKVKMGDISINLGQIYKNNEDFYKAYSPFKNGVEMIATTVGSIFSSNLIAPLLRNPYSARQQKISIEKESIAKKDLNKRNNNSFDSGLYISNISRTGMKI